MNIAILDDYQYQVESLQCFSMLRGHRITVVHDALARLGGIPREVAEAEVLVLMRERTQVDEALLSHLPRLRMISQTGPVPHIDLQACTRRRVLVCSSLASTGEGVPPASRATAELAWGLVLGVMRRIPEEAAALKRGLWQTTIGTGLHGKSLGILGYGRIGTLVAGYGRAFGMRVLAWGREGSLARARADAIEVADSRAHLFRESDVLSLHLLLTRETRNSITSDDLALMKPTALLVNTARAGLLKPGALEAALKAGRPGHAALDVFDSEPVRDAADPLVGMPNTLCTPHIGFVERDSYENIYGRAFAQVLAYAAGLPIAVLNPATEA